MAGKVALLFKVLRQVKSWPAYLLDYTRLLRRPTYTLRLRNGLAYTLRPGTCDRGIVNEVWLLEDYNLHRLGTGNIVIDLGAQIGIFSTYAAHRGCKVYAFEPWKENFDLLVRNVADNGLQQGIIPVNLAVSDKNRVLTFYVSDINTGGHSALMESDHAVKVTAISLAELFRRYKILACDLLKIDTEGSEYPILYSAPQDVLRRIRRLIIECHTIKKLRGYNKEALATYLERKGFRVTVRGQYIDAERQER